MSIATPWTRRDAIKLAAALGMTPSVLRAAEENTMRTRAIPKTGEELPIIGLGTYEVFDVGDEALAPRREIVDLLFEKGGSVIDTSPMYDRSEAVVGNVLGPDKESGKAFLATKVWTDGRESGARQMQRSMELMNAEVIDLMQVHNLRDTGVHLDTIRAWQAEGRIRYSGITHYRAAAIEDMATAMKRFRPEFIQINYSLGEREADERLLPIAADMDIAVLANRPYMAGQLFRAVRGRQLPDWAREFADSWGQFFLKYIVSHEAVTCAIPATSDPEHMLDNLGAGFGPLPDAATRARMVRLVESL